MRWWWPCNENLSYTASETHARCFNPFLGVAPAVRGYLDLVETLCGAGRFARRDHPGGRRLRGCGLRGVARRARVPSPARREQLQCRCHFWRWNSAFVSNSFAWIHTELGLRVANDPTAPVIHSLPRSALLHHPQSLRALGAEDLVTTPDAAFWWPSGINSSAIWFTAAIAATIVTLIGRARPANVTAPSTTGSQRSATPASPEQTPDD